MTTKQQARDMRSREVFHVGDEEPARWAEIYQRFLNTLHHSSELLSQSKPATFLGRKTQEPFPINNDGL